MTEVIFHTAVSDPLKHIVKLTLKALSQSLPMVIYSNDEVRLKTISDSLWGHDQGAFIPHCHWNAPNFVRERSHIFLTNDPRHSGLPSQSLIHWGPDTPTGFASFERYVEIIGTDLESVQSGRQKWKTYQQMGYPLRHVAIQSKT